ncbi:MAG: hypothetical protein IMW86_01930 [Hydrogenibacillus sp.]|nr:hypothetical protein [Hydrogenibacillus sp.]
MWWKSGKSAARAAMSLAAALWLGACSPQIMEGGQNARTSQEARNALSEMSAALDRASFEFDGEVHWQDAGSASEPAALFHGGSSPSAFYVMLSVTPKDGGFADDMEIFTRGEEVYMRFADEVNWEAVGGGERKSVREEIDNWDPRAHVKRMQALAQNVVFNVPPRGDAGIIRVELDPKALLAELRRDIAGRSAPEPASTERAVEHLSAGSKVDDRPYDGDEELSGTYIVTYDVKTALPKRIEYIERAVYADQGARTDDTTRYVFTFRRFGEFVPPDLVGIPERRGG